jgi:copper chaperone CopZ/thiol-disulfide isomerase/thioredoxin
MFVFGAIFSLWLAPAQAEVILLDLDGMTCLSCEGKVQRAVGAIDGVAQVHASMPGQAACIELEGEVSDIAVAAAIGGLGYTVDMLSRPDRCPDSLLAETYPDPWEDTAGVDAAIISEGDELAFADHLVASKFTIFDFGAPWCGPCHVAASTLRGELTEANDIAVRAISLGQDPRASFQFPVAKQHLAFAPGLPWFVVYSPKGKAIYTGSNVDKALAMIEKKR